MFLDFVEIAFHAVPAANAKDFCKGPAMAKLHEQGIRHEGGQAVKELHLLRKHDYEFVQAAIKALVETLLVAAVPQEQHADYSRDEQHHADKSPDDCRSLRDHIIKIIIFSGTW